MVTLILHAQYRAVLGTDKIELHVGETILREVLLELVSRSDLLKKYLNLHDPSAFRSHALIISEGKIMKDLDEKIPDGCSLELYPTFNGG